MLVQHIEGRILYKKMGFVIEGVYKQHGLYNNKYCDTIRMALFNPLLDEND